LRAKYGGDPDTMFARVEGIARETGIALDFSKVRRIPNTLDAHTLATAALEKGTQRALVEALFAAYFLEGRDISDRETLVAIACEHGFTAGEVPALLSERRDETLDRARAAAAEGIDGVPFFVIGERVAFGGAQPIAIFEEAIEKALSSGKVG
jgi:predicted DsbA family dithiol-disulfide isomerase